MKVRDYTNIRIVETPESEKLIGRLFNGKPESALRYSEGQPQDVRDDIQILIDCFGNIMCCDGSIGSLGAALICTMIGQDDY